MLGHKKTNCRSLPITDFFVNTVPTESTPAVEQASYDSTDKEAEAEASGSNNVDQMPDYSEPLDHMPQTFSNFSSPVYYPYSTIPIPINPNLAPLPYYPQVVPNNLIRSGVDEICAPYYQNQLNSQINMDLSNLGLVSADTTTQLDLSSFNIQSQQYPYQYPANTEGLQFPDPFNFNFY